MSNRDVLELFNCIVVDDNRVYNNDYNTDLIDMGIVTDFILSRDDRAVLSSVLKPLNMKTLFTREERNTTSVEQLLIKQFFHYIEVYGLGAPGLFNLETSNGEVVSLRFVRGITVEELGTKVRELLYSNAPIKDSAQIKRIIDTFFVIYNVNLIENNELRVILWNSNMSPFTNGDDAVRYMCYKATGSTMLIKSRQVIEAIKKSDIPVEFLEMHAYALSQVFNRHKKLIMAAKNNKTRTVINKISRMSKKNHARVYEHVSKSFVHKALTIGYGIKAILGEEISLRDKMKFLNVIADKKAKKETNLYKIRNGKVFYEPNTKSYDNTK